ncbi:MAG: IPT/TIG domain-containing protein, partial [Muribaculaceae bacterium]|nr:IPT/TIG domain-containing protein [Muribaculaceae bacterium]
MKKTLYILAALLLCCAGFTGCSDDDDSTTAGMGRLKLISVIPKAASSGETAIISGNGFATDPAQNEVTINGKKAEVVSATADRLVITLPDNPDGTYSVTVKTGGKEVEGLHITYAPGRVKELAVLQCMPSYAYAGEQIKIIGQCFSEVAAENKVSINGAE